MTDMEVKVRDKDLVDISGVVVRYWEVSSEIEQAGRKCTRKVSA